MRWWCLSPVATAAWLFVLPHEARAQEEKGAGAVSATSAQQDSEAYCAWVTSVAASESDPFLLPSVFGTVGYVSGADASDGGSALPPTQRLIAGAAYSFGASGLNRGLALRAVADAECKRYASTAVLRAFVERHHDPSTVRALTAKRDALQAALPHAAEILAQATARLAQARATVDEVDATRLRVDALRQLAAETSAQLDALAAAPGMPEVPIAQVLAERDSAEAEAERKAARLREAHGWDLTVRGGYDRIFGARDYTPLFATATLTLNLGWLLQGGSDEGARKARHSWVRSEVLGLDDRVAQAVAALRGARDAEVGRLRETSTLLADLEARLGQMTNLTGEHARDYADVLWFDVVRLRAEHAYLEQHVRDLTALLGGAP